MKKIIAMSLICCVLLSVSGCSAISNLFNKSKDGNIIAADAETLEDGREVEGYGEGRIGDTISTAWFDFKVESASYATEYKGQKAADGNEFAILSLTVKNTFGEKLPMWGDDFIIQWGDGYQDYGYALESFNDKMLPNEYEIARAESKTYDAVFEIPADNTGEFNISFQELYEDDIVGNTFFVFFEKDKK